MADAEEEAVKEIVTAVETPYEEPVAVEPADEKAE